MAIVVKEEKIKEVPVLFVSKEDSQAKSVIFLFHKLLNNKEQGLPLAYELAKEDYLVILLDMHGHGQREISYDTSRRYEFNHLLKDIQATEADVKTILNSEKLNTLYGLKNLKIKVAGVSIGGTIALSCFMHMKEIDSMVSIAGTYDLKFIINNDRLDSFKLFAASSPVIDYERAKEERKTLDIANYLSNEKARPALFMDGMLDTTVSIDARKEFHYELMKIYKSYGKENLIKHKEYAKTGHEVTKQMVKDLIEWLSEQEEGVGIHESYG